VRLYIDSADIQEIEQALRTGYVYGVTTNPTLLEKAGVQARDVPFLATRVFSSAARELHVQVYSEETGLMIREAETLAALDPARVVVKIPATPAGYAAASQLAARGVRITMTAVFTVAQVILAQNVGARYAAVYLGRLNDEGVDGLALVGQMQRTLTVQRAEVEILAASIRATADVEALAELGVATVTVPAAVLRQLPDSPRTAAAVAAFAQAARALQ
jgi:transaldolase